MKTFETWSTTAAGWITLRRLMAIRGSGCVVCDGRLSVKTMIPVPSRFWLLVSQLPKPPLGATRAKKNRGREVYPLPAVGSAA
jgi:hypothetical protein